MSDMRVPLPVELETVVRFTTLGVRFWDAARETAIGPGLDVIAWPEDQPRARRTRAGLTHSDVYAFHDLPGMRVVEQPQGERAPDSPPFTRRFVVAVNDGEGRYLPVVFRVDLPYRGIYPTASSASPSNGSPPGFYLFAAPTRPTAGLAVVRAELVEHATRRPAAHALIEVIGTDGTWYGVADARGMVMVAFAYPGFGAAPPSSPPRSPSTAREPQRWPVTARVRYEPAMQQVPPGAALPDLASIFAQAPASVRRQDGGPATDDLAVELEFGRDLLLASTPLNVLLVG